MGHRLGGNTISPDASNPVSGIPELFLSSSRGFNEARVLLADTMQQLSVMTLYCSTCKYCSTIRILDSRLEVQSPRLALLNNFLNTKMLNCNTFLNSVTTHVHCQRALQRARRKDTNS